MTVVLNNNATGTLAQGISASAVQLQLNPGEGAAFPVLGAGEYFFATLVSPGGALEIVKATYRIADLVGIVRAQEGTQARSFPAGSLFELRVTVGNVTALIPEPQITVSSTPPPSPALDDLWLETDVNNPSGEVYAPVDHTHSDMVALAGAQTITGAKTFRPTSGSLSLSVRKQLVSNQAVMDFRDEVGVQRNILGLTSGVASDFFIGRYDSEGAWQGSVVYVPSATGVANFLTTPTVGGVAMALSNATVNLTSAQTVAGVKTFSDEAILSSVRVDTSTGPRIVGGTGTPEAAVTAPVGSLYLRTDGGVGTTLYVKETGTGNTGWVAK